MKETSLNNRANREDTGRNPDGTFKEGVSGNPAGRPKNTLKDYVRRKFMEMSDEEKDAFLKTVSPDIMWKMGEGNPDTALTGADGKDLIPDTEERRRLKEAAHGTLGRI